MAKKKEEKEFYSEDLVWMSYRYAIGLPSDKEDEYFAFEFNSPEYHALVSEFRDFLKYKKRYKNLGDIMAKHPDQDLMYLSTHYACGRRTYAAMHAGEIARKGYNMLSRERKEFNAKDIRREIFSSFAWHTPNLHVDLHIQDNYSPVELIMNFFKEKNINNVNDLRKIERVDYGVLSDDTMGYTVKLYPDGEEPKYCFASDVEEYLCWEDLASCFDMKNHKFCKVNYNGKEEVIEYFDSWVRDYDNNVYWEDIEKYTTEQFHKAGYQDNQYLTFNGVKDLVREIEVHFGVPEHNDTFKYYYEGQNSIREFAIKIYQAYSRIVKPEDYFYFKKIKRCLNNYLANPYTCCYINEDYIIEDNIQSSEIID